MEEANSSLPGIHIVAVLQWDRLRQISSWLLEGWIWWSLMALGNLSLLPLPLFLHLSQLRAADEKKKKSQSSCWIVKLNWESWYLCQFCCCCFVRPKTLCCRWYGKHNSWSKGLGEKSTFWQQEIVQVVEMRTTDTAYKWKHMLIDAAPFKACDQKKRQAGKEWKCAHFQLQETRQRN